MFPCDTTNVGASGQGKSTIMRLLYRFYEIDSGEILIDGQNIQHVTQASLRENIGIVPQDTSLFNDTIEYNIAYGKFGYSSDKLCKPVSHAEVVEAAKQSQIYDFIEKQADKFNTRIGERGAKLSGGEKQRVSIARAILKSPRIMIFDEATSSLDTGTEKQILEQLENSFVNTHDKQFTVLSIAHRLSTIANSDKILVLDNGHVSEHGTHIELLQQNGIYAKLWFKQERTNQLAAELSRNASPMPHSYSNQQLQSAPAPAPAPDEIPLDAKAYRGFRGVIKQTRITIDQLRKPNYPSNSNTDLNQPLLDHSSDNESKV